MLARATHHSHLGGSGKTDSKAKPEPLRDSPWAGVPAGWCAGEALDNSKQQQSPKARRCLRIHQCLQHLPLTRSVDFVGDSR